MAEDVDVPKVGAVDKKVVAAIVVAAGGFVGYRYWTNRGSATADTGATDATVTSEFDDSSGDPSAVLGAVRPGNDYGQATPAGDTPQPTTDDFGFHGTTNDAWSQYAAAQLSQSDRWSYTDVVEALGAFLAQRPTTTAQQTIVNAAIAVAGHPPSGSPVLVSGGNVPLTVAPTITNVTVTESTAVLSFSTVAGADSYWAYRNGVATNVAAGKTSPITVAGLAPATDYTFTVRGVTAAGTTGPQSAGVKAKTKATVIGVPVKPTISNIGATSATFSVPAAKGATGYRWFVNGSLWGTSDHPTYTSTHLKSKTKYSVTVQADNASQAPSASSAATAFTTK